MLYHHQVFWPEHVDRQVRAFRTLRLSRPTPHGRKEARQDRYADLIRLPRTVYVPNTTAFEAETADDGIITKLCVRQVYDDDRDLSLVLRPGNRGNWFIITAWLNERSDRHSTLNRAAYTQA
mgnify:CR=1 FL=1